jgi:hypothetical protein
MRVYLAVRPTKRIWSFRFGWGIFPVGCSVGSSMVVPDRPVWHYLGRAQS